eukprot:jgi/Antlo1/567/2260
MSHDGCSQRNLIAIIADEETLSGFALTGIPLSRDAPNFISVSKEITDEELEKHIEQLASRSDVAIVFVADFLYCKARDYIQKYEQSLPCFLKIPSKLGLR